MAWATWRQRLFVLVKVGRTGFIGFSLYQAGQASGITEYAKDPAGTEYKIATTLAMGSGATDFIRGQTADYKRTKLIANRVVEATTQHIDLKIMELIQIRDRIVIRNMQLDAAEESVSKVVKAKKELPEKRRTPADLLMAKDTKSISRGIDTIDNDGNHRILEKLAHKTEKKRSIWENSYKPPAKKEERMYIEKLSVPDRLDLPQPLLLHYKSSKNHLEELAMLMEKHDVEYDPTMTKERLEEMYRGVMQELERWAQARKIFQGGLNLVMTNAETPNAFVSPMLPKLLFVHQGLLDELNPTDDELLLVLAHEVSHLVLSHTEEQQYEQTCWQMLRLVFSAVVGFDWFWLTDLLLSNSAALAGASFSRQCETEADTLGVQIAARACCDVKLGANVFRKLAAKQREYKTQASSNKEDSNGEKIELQQVSVTPPPPAEEEAQRAGTTLWDTHPLSEDRYQNVLELCKTVNRENINPSCSKAKKYLAKAIPSKYETFQNPFT